MLVLEFFNKWDIFWEDRQLLAFIVGFISLLSISIIIAAVNKILGGSGCTKGKK